MVAGVCACGFLCGCGCMRLSGCGCLCGCSCMCDCGFLWLAVCAIGLVYWGLTPQQQPGSYQGGEMMMMKSVFFWWRKPEYRVCKAESMHAIFGHVQYNIDTVYFTIVRTIMLRQIEI